MTVLTWHLEQAKKSLNHFYNKHEELMRCSELAVLSKSSRFNREWSSKYKSIALRAKTAGLVYHDRWKMILDCRRTVVAS